LSPFDDPELLELVELENRELLSRASWPLRRRPPYVAHALASRTESAAFSRATSPLENGMRLAIRDEYRLIAAGIVTDCR
jgi:hypothetical protein